MLEVGDLVRVNQCFMGSYDLGKLAIVVNVGTWSCDIHIIESGRKPRYAKADLTKLEKL